MFKLLSDEEMAEAAGYVYLSDFGKKTHGGVAKAQMKADAKALLNCRAVRVRSPLGWNEFEMDIYLTEKEYEALKELVESKPLSAKADSFSLPDPTGGGREV